VLLADIHCWMAGPSSATPGCHRPDPPPQSCLPPSTDFVQGRRWTRFIASASCPSTLLRCRWCPYTLHTWPLGETPPYPTRSVCLAESLWSAHSSFLSPCQSPLRCSYLSRLLL